MTSNPTPQLPLSQCAVPLLTGGELRLIILHDGPCVGHSRASREPLPLTFLRHRSLLADDAPEGEPALSDREWFASKGPFTCFRVRSATLADWIERHAGPKPPRVPPMFRPVTLARIAGDGIVKRALFVVHVSGPHFIPVDLKKRFSLWEGLAALDLGKPR